MVDFKITNKDGSTASWSSNDVQNKLKGIQGTSKKHVWIRSDLSTRKSNWLTRLFWTLIGKRSDWIRENFYGVDLERSKEILNQLKPQIEELKDPRMVDLFNRAVKNFNEIAPGHKADSIDPVSPEGNPEDNNLEEPVFADLDVEGLLADLAKNDPVENDPVENDPIEQVLPAEQVRSHPALAAPSDLSERSISRPDELTLPVQEKVKNQQIVNPNNECLADISGFMPIVDPKKIVTIEENEGRLVAKASISLDRQIRYTTTDNKRVNLGVNGRLEIVRQQENGKQRDELIFVGTIFLKGTTYDIRTRAVVPDVTQLTNQTLCRMFYNTIIGVDSSAMKGLGGAVRFSQLFALPTTNSNLLTDGSEDGLLPENIRDTILRFQDDYREAEDEFFDGSGSARQLEERVESLEKARAFVEEYFHSLRNEDSRKENLGSILGLFEKQLNDLRTFFEADDPKNDLKSQDLMMKLESYSSNTQVYIKDGMILLQEALKEGEIPSPSENSQALKSLLTNLYGEKIAEKQIKFHKISDKKPLTVGELRNVLFDHLLGSVERRQELKLKPTHCDLRQALDTFLKSDKEIADSDSVEFNRGKIKKLSENISPDEVKDHRMRQKKIFIQMLTETYGKELTRALIPYYNLHKLYHDDNQDLTLGMVKKVLVGIAANVHVKDLKSLHQQISEDQGLGKEHMRMSCEDFLREVDEATYESLKKCEFEELNPQQILFLLGAFRSLPGHAESYKVLFPDHEEMSEPGKFDSFGHDLKFLKSLFLSSMLKLEDEGLGYSQHRLAVCEYLARSVSYFELKPGMMFTLPNSINEQQLYHVNRSLDRKGDAVICDLITPVNRKQSLSSEGKEEVFLTFRGSCPQNNRLDSGGTWNRDLNYRGVGRKEFPLRKAEIVAMLEDYIKERPDDAEIILNISGYSLGGADTQRCIAAIFEAIHDSSADSPLRRIKKVVAMTHSSPRINPSLNTDCKRYVAEMMKSDLPLPDFDLVHVQIRDKKSRAFGKRKGQDLVQLGGDVLIGADMVGNNQGDKLGTVFADAPFIHRYIVDVQFDGTLSYLQRHTTSAFVKEEALKKGSRFGSKIHVYSVEDEKQRKLMEKYMAWNFYWNNKKAAVLNLVNSAHWYVTERLLRPVASLKGVMGAIGGIYGMFYKGYGKGGAPNPSRIEQIRV